MMSDMETPNSNENHLKRLTHDERKKFFLDEFWTNFWFDSITVPEDLHDNLVHLFYWFLTVDEFDTLLSIKNELTEYIRKFSIVTDELWNDHIGLWIPQDDDNILYIFLQRNVWLFFDELEHFKKEINKYHWSIDEWIIHYREKNTLSDEKTEEMFLEYEKRMRLNKDQIAWTLWDQSNE